MKNGFLIFLGLFAALVLSWAGIVLGSNAQLGALAPYFDEGENKAFPERASGIAARGQFVYVDLGCASCHTQQARRPDFGADQARGWGERQSYARDYVYQTRVQLGQMRVGPDLSNLATRKPPYEADDLLGALYTGVIPPAKVATHPSYKFLFDERTIDGQHQHSDRALNLGSKFAPPAGQEIIPSERAQTLVAYLLSLNNSYAYPEESGSNTVKPAAKEKEEGHNPAASKPGAEKTPAAAPAKEGAAK